jgi:soluble lytic murein transglycosylase-like protein
MVKPWLLGCAATVLFAGHAAGAEPEWKAAGGDIFAASDIRTREPAALPEALAQLPPSTQPLDVAVGEAASRHRIDPKLLHALVTVESAYRANAVSPAGAGGLTQLMPATAKSLGVEDRFDPAANLSGGADYLARQLLRFGDLRLALAAYNAGPDRVARLGRIPSFPETQAYVAAVVECYLALTAGRSVRTRRDCQRTGP